MSDTGNPQPGTTDRPFKITGMHCPTCEGLVGEVLAKHPDVASIQVDRQGNRFCATFHQPIAESDLKIQWNQALEPMGYRVYLPDENPQSEIKRETLWGVLAGFGFLLVFVGLQVSGVVHLFSPEKLEIPDSFILGLMASVSSCFALTGGLLMTFTASVGQRNPQSLPIALTAFHLARIIGFFLLGGVLGQLGQALAINQKVFVFLFGLAALIMVLLGLNLLGVWQGLFKGRRMTSPDKAAGAARIGLAKRAAALGTVGGGLLLGLGTFFLPCGFTQAVQVQALASGSFLAGSLLTLAFVAGTFPVLLGVSLALNAGLSGRLRNVLLKASGVVVLGLGLYQMQSVLTLLGWIKPLLVF